MADEATLLVQNGIPINFTCADGTGIEKGALLKMADPMTASLSAAQDDVVGGIAAAEKIANDGVTKIAVFRSGIFKVTASGSITVGDALVLDPVPVGNYVSAAAVDAENIIGIALETASVGETFKMELKPVTVNQA